MKPPGVEHNYCNSQKRIPNVLEALNSSYLHISVSEPRGLLKLQKLVHNNLAAAKESLSFTIDVCCGNLGYMVVSINGHGTPIETPKYYNPYHGDLQNRPSNLGKPPAILTATQ